MSSRSLSFAVIAVVAIATPGLVFAQSADLVLCDRVLQMEKGELRDAAMPALQPTG